MNLVGSCISYDHWKIWFCISIVPMIILECRFNFKSKLSSKCRFKGNLFWFGSQVLLCKYWWAAACTFCRVFNLQHIFFARIAMLWGGKLSAVIVVWCPFQECRTIGFQHLFLHRWFFYANFSSHNSSTVLYFVLSRWVSTPLILFQPAFVVLTCKIKI